MSARLKVCVVCGERPNGPISSYVVGKVGREHGAVCLACARLINHWLRGHRRSIARWERENHRIMRTVGEAVRAKLPARLRADGSVPIPAPRVSP